MYRVFFRAPVRLPAAASKESLRLHDFRTYEYINRIPISQLIDPSTAILDYMFAARASGRCRDPAMIIWLSTFRRAQRTKLDGHRLLEDQVCVQDTSAAGALQWLVLHSFLVTSTPAVSEQPESFVNCNQVAALQSPTGKELPGLELALSLARITAVENNLRSLTCLELRANGLDAQASESIAPALAQLSSLAVLNLEGNRIGAEGAAALCSSIASSKTNINCPALRTLDLSSNALGDEGVKAITPHLSKLVALGSLCLGSNNITALGIKKLGSTLKKLKNSLQELDLSDNDLGAKGTEALGSALEHLSGLQKLNLSANRSMSAQGQFCLWPQLRELSMLQVLRVSDVRLGVEGCAALGPFLSQLVSLQELDLSRNGMGDAGVAALEPHLAQATSIRVLDLSENSISEDGALALSHSISYLTELMTLNVAGNSIGSKGAKALGPSLALMQGLETLNLSTNKIGDKGVKAMEPYLEMMRSLKKLSLEWNRIGESMLGMSTVKRKLKSKLSFVENLGL